MAESRSVAVVTDVTHFIGTSSARALAEAGHEVWCQDADFADAQVRAAYEAAQPGLRALEAQDGAAIVAELKAHGAAAGVLVNNDAYPAERAPVDEADPNTFRRTLEALAVVPFERTAAVVPGMKAAGTGRILFVTSAAPLRGLPNYSIYAAARGTANALARSLALELAPHGIQVNAVAPNFVASPTYFPDHLMNDPKVAPRILKNIPLGRLGTQDEAGALVAFLASDQAGFVTGQVIPLAGGWA